MWHVGAVWTGDNTGDWSHLKESLPVYLFTLPACWVVWHLQLPCCWHVACRGSNDRWQRLWLVASECVSSNLRVYFTGLQLSCCWHVACRSSMDRWQHRWLVAPEGISSNAAVTQSCRYYTQRRRRRRFLQEPGCRTADQMVPGTITLCGEYIWLIVLVVTLKIRRRCW